MQFTTFLRTGRRHWVVPAALLAAAMIGVFLFQAAFGLKEAVATVAVLDPLTARAGAYVQAQVTFDSVIQSQALAERVAARLSRNAGDVRGHLSVSIAPSLSTFNASPVYAVYATDKTSAGALALANAAVEEGRLLYIEDNTPDPNAVADAVAGQMKTAQADLDAAVTAYAAFLRTNDASDLEPRIGKLRDIVYSLRLSALQARADAKSQYASGNISAGVAANSNAAGLEAETTAQQLKLNKLLNLEIPFGILSSNIQTAQTRVNQLRDYEVGTLTGEQLPLAGQVKLIDPAKLNSHLLVTLLTYAIAALVALVAGATAIYVLALLSPEPETAEAIGRAFGAPVLAHVPSGAA